MLAASYVNTEQPEYFSFASSHFRVSEALPFLPLDGGWEWRWGEMRLFLSWGFQGPFFYACLPSPFHSPEHLGEDLLGRGCSCNHGKAGGPSAPLGHREFTERHHPISHSAILPRGSRNIGLQSTSTRNKVRSFNPSASRKGGDGTCFSSPQWGSEPQMSPGLSGQRSQGQTPEPDRHRFKSQSCHSYGIEG